MKTKLLAFFFLLTASASAQIINFTNPALKQQLLDAGDYNLALNSSGNYMEIDANNDDEIDVSEAQQVWWLMIGDPSITNLQGMEYFTQLRTFSIANSGITSFNIYFPNIVWLELIDNHSLVSVNVSSLTTMTTFTCRKSSSLASITYPTGNTLTGLNVSECALTSIDMSNRTNLQYLNVDFNPMTSINVSGTGMVTISCQGNLYTELNLSGLTALTGFTIGGNWNMTSLNLSGCTSLQSSALYFDFFTFNHCENIQTMNFSGCTGLTEFDINAANLQTLNLSGCTGLTMIEVGGGTLSSLNTNGCTALETISVGGANLTSLDLSTSPNLKILNANGNPLTSLNLTGCDLLEEIQLQDTELASFVLTNRTHLNIVQLYPNPTIQTLNLSGCAAMYSYQFPEAVHHMDLSGCEGIGMLFITSPVLETLDIQGCTSLNEFILNYNNAIGQPISSIDFTNLPNLSSVTIGNSGLTSLDFTGCPNLQGLVCKDTPITSINFEEAEFLSTIMLENIPIQTLDLTHQYHLSNVTIPGCTELESIFAKNGATDNIHFSYDNYSLAYVCQDENLIATTQNFLTQVDHPVSCNSYCSFTPGGSYNTVTGNILLDADNNGCGSGDIPHNNIKIGISDGSQTASTFTDDAGNYVFYAGAGNYNLTPSFENSTFFAISPATQAVPFADSNNNTATQDFCITPIGNHSDVEIVVAPLNSARPGFTAIYRIILRNKGNQSAAGSFSYAYDDSVLDFVSSTVAPDSQSAGLLTWNYISLAPFESRTVTVSMDVNTPTQTPPVNDGDVLSYTLALDPLMDDNSQDNHMIFNQVVVNSFDPNDITCIEGSAVSPTEIGNYLHYIVNFENLGTAEAVNVVVKTEIDQAKFDLNSLQLLSASHPAYTRITGNIVEFIFEGINLAEAQGNPAVGGRGNVIFKIKSKNSLVQGDFVEASAKIYFDYNFPVETNTAHTVFQALSNPETDIDRSIRMYPNPAANNVSIECDSVIRTMELFDIQGRLLLASPVNANVANLNISDQSKGIYFIKITSDKGQKVEKLIKE